MAILGVTDLASLDPRRLVKVAGQPLE